MSVGNFMLCYTIRMMVQIMLVNGLVIKLKVLGATLGWTVNYMKENG